MRLQSLSIILALLLTTALTGFDSSSLSDGSAGGNALTTNPPTSEPDPDEHTYAVADASTSPGSHDEGAMASESDIAGPMDPNLPPSSPSEGDKYEDVGANPFTVVTVVGSKPVNDITIGITNIDVQIAVVGKTGNFAEVDLKIHCASGFCHHTIEVAVAG